MSSGDVSAVSMQRRQPRVARWGGGSSNVSGLPVGVEHAVEQVARLQAVRT